MLIDCSQTRPGPVSAARNRPEPPKNLSWMHAQGVARLEVVDHDLAVQLDPRQALAREPLHAKPGAAEHAGAQPLLKRDRELHADRRAHETVPVDQVAVPRRDLEGHDLPWQLRREGEQSRTT